MKFKFNLISLYPLDVCCKRVYDNNELENDGLKGDCNCGSDKYVIEHLKDRLEVQCLKCDNITDTYYKND